MSEKTMIDIAGLRAKLAVGSAAPWDVIDNYLYSTQLASASKDDVPPSVGMTQRNEDASLIASLVNAIPALLDAYEAQAERIAALEGKLKRNERRESNSSKYWLRAAKSALSGDSAELRNRVAMAEAPSVDVVLSDLTGEA